MAENTFWMATINAIFLLGFYGVATFVVTQWI